MRLALVFSLIALAVAGSAVAQEKRLKLVAPAAALRGPEVADARPQPAPAPVLARIQPAPAAPQDPSACRTGCAQAYYFCLSGSDDQCPVRWGKCVLDCSPVAPPAT